MAGNGGSDQINLLQHVASMGKLASDYDSSKSGYEMVDMESSDIGTHKGSISSQYPQTYSSTWETEFERTGKIDDSYNE